MSAQAGPWEWLQGFCPRSCTPGLEEPTELPADLERIEHFSIPVLTGFPSPFSLFSSLSLPGEVHKRSCRSEAAPSSYLHAQCSRAPSQPARPVSHHPPRASRLRGGFQRVFTGVAVGNGWLAWLRREGMETSLETKTLSFLEIQKQQGPNPAL